MAELDRLIIEARTDRTLNRRIGRGIEAAASAIREVALLHAKQAVIAELTGQRPTLEELGWRWR